MWLLNSQCHTCWLVCPDFITPTSCKHVSVCRHLAAATAAVQAAAAAGRQPQLRSLLVEPSWLEVLGPEFDKPYMQELESFLHKEWASQVVYPPPASVFRAFNTVPFDKVGCFVVREGGADSLAGHALAQRTAAVTVRMPPFLDVYWCCRYGQPGTLSSGLCACVCDCSVQVRVVILGQDPYKNEGEAMGLSFSVPPGRV